jgi:hypothetical protein
MECYVHTYKERKDFGYLPAGKGGWTVSFNEVLIIKNSTMRCSRMLFTQKKWIPVLKKS